MADRNHQVVSGDTYLGEPYYHYYQLVTTADPGATGYTSVDCSAQVPAGTTMIYIQILTKGTAANDTLSIFTDSTPTPARAFIQARVAASMYGVGSGLVKLSSTRTFVYWASSSNLYDVDISMFIYWV